MSRYTGGYALDWQDNSAYEEYYAKLAGSNKPESQTKTDQPKSCQEIGKEEMSTCAREKVKELRL